MTLPQYVRVVEVGPRDGLQNESVTVSTDDKVRFVERLADAGLPDIEVSSFVSPARVPQLADAADVFARLLPRPGTRYSALVPNERGLERAVNAGVRAISLFTAASETFTQRNISMSIGESLDTFRALMPRAQENTLWVRAYVSMAFVCPFEGEITPASVVPIVQELVSMGVDEVSLGDTVGRATPEMVGALLDALAPVLPIVQTACHFHETHGAALSNVEAALHAGVSVFDAAAGGTGGCPFAPGSAGNLATETLLTFLHGRNIETGVDTQKVMDAAQFIKSRLG